MGSRDVGGTSFPICSRQQSISPLCLVPSMLRLTRVRLKPFLSRPHPGCPKCELASQRSALERHNTRVCPKLCGEEVNLEIINKQKRLWCSYFVDMNDIYHVNIVLFV